MPDDTPGSAADRFNSVIEEAERPVPNPESAIPHPEQLQEKPKGEVVTDDTTVAEPAAPQIPDDVFAEETTSPQPGRYQPTPQDIDALMERNRQLEAEMARLATMRGQQPATAEQIDEGIPAGVEDPLQKEYWRQFAELRKTVNGLAGMTTAERIRNSQATVKREAEEYIKSQIINARPGLRARQSLADAVLADTMEWIEGRFQINPNQPFYKHDVKQYFDHRLKRYADSQQLGKKQQAENRAAVAASAPGKMGGTTPQTGGKEKKVEDMSPAERAAHMNKILEGF